MITTENLLKMKERLNSECIDDPEEILEWFAECGVDMIDEIVKNRESELVGKE